MSYVHIVQWQGKPAAGAAGVWYAEEGSAGSVSVLAGEQALHATAGSDAGVAVSEWTGARLFRSGSGKQGAMAYLLKYPVPDDFAWEFEAWFKYEHMPLLHEEPTWYTCDFYRAMRPSSYSYTAIHYLEPGALTSAARDRSIATPWWNRLKQNPWFDKGFVRLRMKPL